MASGDKEVDVRGVLASQLSSSNSGSNALDLIRVLRELEGIVATEGSSRGEFETTTRSNGALKQKLTTDQLLAIERKAAELRNIGHEFHQGKQGTVSAALSLYGDNNEDHEDELTTSRDKLQHQHQQQQLILTSCSLSVAQRKEVFWECQAVEHLLESIEKLYEDGTEERLREFGEMCRTTSNSLENDAIIGGLSSPNCHFLQSINEQRLREKKFSKSASITERNDNPSSSALTDLHHHAKMQHHQVANNAFASTNHLTRIHKLLVVGPEGSGKTFVCQEIEERAGEGSKVHLLNARGRTIGELEDTIISFFHESHRSCSVGNHLMLVDDFDMMVAKDDAHRTSASGDPSGGGQAHASSRALSSFLVMIDSLVHERIHRPLPEDQLTVFLVCTAKTDINIGLDRFDVVHKMEAPMEGERRKGLVDHLGKHSPLMVALGGDDMTIDIEADSLHRPSVAPPTRSLHDIAPTPRSLEGDLQQSLTPASLMSHTVDGYVDMRVLSGQELLGTMLQGDPGECPLLGHASEMAWKELEWNIVIPISRAAELNLLTHGEESPSDGRRSLCGGVILTGGPGNGKSLLARHCARFAASFLPSVKLIEVSCSSMIHKEIGASERAIHRLFEFARSVVPCIVILDDVAIVSSVRGKDTTKEGTMDRVLSTLLHEMDGVEQNSMSTSPTAGMAIIGVTKDFMAVDPALLRPGRLGRVVQLYEPDKDSRRRIARRELESIFSEMGFASEMPGNSYNDLADTVAEGTEGLSGAGVIALLSDAKLAFTKVLLRRSTKEFTGMEEMIRFLKQFFVNNR